MEVAAEQRVDGETRGLAQHVPACHVQGGLDREVGLAMILKLPSVMIFADKLSTRIKP